MAMQTGIGLSKILIIAGAGYTGTILIKNNKLSDILAELQSLVRGVEKSGSNGEEHTDVAAQVRQLATELRRLSLARPITVLNGNSGSLVDWTSLIIPAATVGALGYGYMWWKGLSFSDLMYVTKQNMANAVTNLTKHLEHVTDTLAATKRHLTQRIENLDGKMDEQKEVSKLINQNVLAACENLNNIDCSLEDLQSLVAGLDWKLGSLEHKQNVANTGVLYLCNFVNGKKVKMPEALQDQLKLSGKSQGLLTLTETPSLQGLKDFVDIADTLSGTINISTPDSSGKDVIEKPGNPPRPLLRAASARC